MPLFGGGIDGLLAQGRGGLKPWGALAGHRAFRAIFTRNQIKRDSPPGGGGYQKDSQPIIS